MSGSAAHTDNFEVFFGGDDVPMLEPIKRLNYRIIDKMVRDLRRIYKENATSFDVPTFAQKVY